MLIQISESSNSGKANNQAKILLRSIPSRELLFDPVRDSYGSRLAITFGNENKDGKCPFYASQCYHCDIGSGENQRFDISLNHDRLLFFEAYYGDALLKVNHLMIYNSGSALNSNELSDGTLSHILAYAKSLESCKVISFDTREMYITKGKLDFLTTNLREDQRPMAILGLETQDDHIRMGLLSKKMSRNSVDRAFEVISKCESKVGIDVNVLFQPPGIIGQDAITEAVATVSYLLELNSRHCIPLDINFHPYYPSKIGTEKFPDHPRADIKDAIVALKVIINMLRTNSSESQLFIGWQDESHDVEKEKRIEELMRYKNVFNLFNISQNPEILK